MCGLVAALGPDFGKRNDLLRGIEQSLSSLVYRGPDSQLHKSFTDNFVCGHARLAISDSHSELANQPLISQDGQTIILFNGEIYNALELWDLYGLTVELKTDSDTEK